MEQTPLKLGAAYHGNRMPHHVHHDMRDMMKNGMDLAVHMFSHTDWDRHMNKMKEIITISHDVGLETWVDNWGLAGPPGDKSHFLSYHPNAHQIYSNGDMDPVRVCLNNPDFRKFTYDWIDAVEYIGSKTIFWDEPHLPLKAIDQNTYYACACPLCKEKFEAKYHHPMPDTLTEEANQFRIDTIVDYFHEVTAYSAAKGMENVLCAMLGTHHGLSLETLGQIASLDTLHNIGSDPYWLFAENLKSPYEFVYENSKKNIDICRKYQKNHNIWIQTYDNPRGREEEIIEATEAAYDAGARTIIAWGYYGSASNDYAAKNPELTWVKTCEAFKRIREMDRDRLLAENRKKYKK